MVDYRHKNLGAQLPSVEILDNEERSAQNSWAGNNDVNKHRAAWKSRDIPTRKDDVENAARRPTPRNDEDDKEDGAWQKMDYKSGDGLG